MCVCIFFQGLVFKNKCTKWLFRPLEKRMQESDGDEFFVLCVCVCVCSKKAGKALNLKIENTEREGARGAETER